MILKGPYQPQPLCDSVVPYITLSLHSIFLCKVSRAFTKSDNYVVYLVVI